MTGLYMHYLFHCKKCGFPTQIPTRTIGDPFGPPELRSSNAPFVALSCSSCKHVDMYVLMGNQPLPHSGSDMAVLSPQAEVYGFVKWLECEEESCRTPLPIYAVRKPGMTDEEKLADIATWSWENLTCYKGHPIPLPQKK